jgi:hypothetical protein
MLRDHRFVTLVDFPQLYDVFPGVKIRGGVSYFLMGSRPPRWQCEQSITMIGMKSSATRPLVRKLDAYDVLVRRNEGLFDSRQGCYRVKLAQQDQALGWQA